MSYLSNFAFTDSFSLTPGDKSPAVFAIFRVKPSLPHGHNPITTVFLNSLPYCINKCQNNFFLIICENVIYHMHFPIVTDIELNFLCFHLLGLPLLEFPVNSLYHLYQSFSQSLCFLFLSIPIPLTSFYLAPY